MRSDLLDGGRLTFHGVLLHVAHEQRARVEAVLDAVGASGKWREHGARGDTWLFTLDFDADVEKAQRALDAVDD